MDLLQTFVTAATGLVSAVITALVTYNITKRQERRKYERDVAAKLAEFNSADASVTRLFAIQHAQACLVVAKTGSPEKSKYFLPAGCRVTLGRGGTNSIIVEDKLFSATDATLFSIGEATFLEPLQPANSLTVNGSVALTKCKLSDGDVISKNGSHVSITFVQMHAAR